MNPPEVFPAVETSDADVAFADVPERDLLDVYSYIRSIPQGAPPLDNIPILKGIADRRTKAN
jgi:hypothetical protein